MAKKKTPTKKTVKKKTVKKGAGISKTQAVRDQLEKTPDAPAKEVAEAASKRVGKKVDVTVVYNIRSNEGGGKKRGTRGKTAAAGGVDTALIKEAATLLQHAGGDPKAAREALGVAEEVSKIMRK